MIKPTCVATDESGTWGLAEWKKDGYIALIKLHRSGDWFTVRPATQGDIETFKKYGKTPGKCSVEAANMGSNG